MSYELIFLVLIQCIAYEGTVLFQHLNIYNEFYCTLSHTTL